MEEEFEPTTDDGVTNLIDNPEAVDDVVLNTTVEALGLVDIVPTGNADEVVTAPELPKPVGRPSDYTQELADKICSKLAEGISLRTVCLAEDMPNKSTVFRWFREKPDFKDQYVQAKEESADAQHEDLAEIGDEAIIEAKTVNEKAANAVVSAYKLKADNLKWSMSKMKPKKYGDKLDMTTNGKDIPTPIYGGKSTE